MGKSLTGSFKVSQVLLRLEIPPGEIICMQTYLINLKIGEIGGKPD